MTESTDYTGTNFTHNIPFSQYENLTNEEILQRYQDTIYEPEVIGRCVNVVDGDTIDVEITSNQITETIRVRLVSVNTPERNQDGYTTSKKFMAKMCLNQDVGLNIDDEKQQDKYGRVLALVLIDNKNLNEILVHEGLAEIMYIPPTEFSPYEWNDISPSDTPASTENNPVHLNSTIINQKKKLFLYVTQSKDLVWPNKTYNYQVYVKNISGQTIENIKIYVTNPKEVVIEEKKDNTETYQIPTLKTGQSVLININNCVIMQEGYYNVGFVAMGDETEIKTQSLLIKCGYENDNKNILHRIAFYNFSPYEDSYMQKASDFNENVTQLTKVQTKPFEAYNQPFEMDELELDLYAQDMFLVNTDDMPSMYLGRENWESNIKELFEGHSLRNLIQKINQKSEIVDIDFLRTGNNEMEIDFQQIYPNGFIHRFGLMKSEFYKLLGILPEIYSINDDLFRWARFETEWDDFDQGPVTYPIRENDKWNQKPWCGTGYYVYESKIENDKKIYTIEKAIFTKEEDAELYVDNLMIFNSNNFIDDITYTIIKREWLPGIFYVEIPLRDIPANFYIPDVDQIQAIIELTKPYGLKGYPRFTLQDDFVHKMSFNNIPTIIPHIHLDIDEYKRMDYHIRARKYQQTATGLRLVDYGKAADRITLPSLSMNFISYMPKPNIHVIYSKDMSKVYQIPQNLNIFSLEYLNALEDEYFIQVSPDNLFKLVNQNYIKVDNFVWYQTLDEDATVIDINDIELTDDVLIIIQDLCNIIQESFKIENLSLPNEDFDNMQMSQSIKVRLSEETSFDGKKISNNSLNKILLKNPEDICFYLIDDGIFNPVNTQTTQKTLAIPAQYKTLNYYNETTSMLLDFTETREEPSAIKLYKQTLPPHVNINLIFSNVAKTKDFIISYKLLYDDVYQISYKTNKKTETIIKEIATEFDYILCDINNISEKQDLIKIFYGLGDKLYFITAFTTNILENNGYQVRVSLTNDLTLTSDFNFSNGNLIFGNMRYALSNDVEDSYVDWYLSNKTYSNTISTDNYQIQENLESDTIWQNLYRINKDETSFALFENTIGEKTPINDVELSLADLNIPQNSIVDKIYLDIYADSREEIKVSPYFKTNTNILHDNENISSIFSILSYERYYQNNLKYLYNQLRYYQEKENEQQIEYYQNLIATHNRQNENVNKDFSSNNPLKISNNYWNEVSFNTTNELLSSNVKTIYLILEGYNHSNNVDIEAQLVYYDGIATPTTTEINTGYFYKKIPINYDAKYNMSELSIRFKFNNIQDIELYDVKSEIYFTSKQDIQRDKIIVDDISINGLDKYFCNIAENLQGDDVRNGLTIGLNFSDVQNYLKIYSIVVNILYHEKAFTNVIEIVPDFNTISATEANGIFRCNVFDEKISDMRQDSYTTQKPNGDYDAGFELDNRIYQAFTAQEDNITSIELKPNGKIGAPDDFLKIAILDNYDNLPNNVLKEVILDIREYTPLDGEAYKFNIYTNNLIKGETYWFSIEPVDKTKKGARRFFYNHNQVDNFKLLSINDGDVVNQHASLYFRLYSRQNNYSFKELPFSFDIDNDYTKDINLITEIQIYDGYIKNLKESLFNDFICQQIVESLLEDNNESSLENDESSLEDGESLLENDDESIQP